eukprot:387537-Amphidinium_carterae.1
MKLERDTPLAAVWELTAKNRAAGVEQMTHLTKRCNNDQQSAAQLVNIDCGQKGPPLQLEKDWDLSMQAAPLI